MPIEGTSDAPAQTGTASATTRTLRAPKRSTPGINLTHVAYPTARGAFMARLRALDAAQQKRPGLALPLAVVKKFGEDNGGQLAGLVAYYAFFSLFPLLLVLTAILGLVLQGNQALQDKILDSSLASFPVIGTQIHHDIHSLNAGGLPLAIGLVATLLGGLGVTHATQVAQDRLWGVPTDKRNSWLRTRTRGLTLLAVLGTVQVVTTVLDGF